jgi:hypothetical protein
MAFLGGGMQVLSFYLRFNSCKSSKKKYPEKNNDA